MWKGSHEPMGALGRSKIADWTCDRARTTRQDSGPFRLYPSPAQLRWATSFECRRPQNILLSGPYNDRIPTVCGAIRVPNPGIISV